MNKCLFALANAMVWKDHHALSVHWKVVFLVLICWFNDILYLSYFKIGEYIGILFMKIVCKQPKMAQVHCHQQKRLTYHFEINRL